MEAIISIIKTTSLVAEKGTHFSSAASLLLLLLLLFTFSLILRQKKKNPLAFPTDPFLILSWKWYFCSEEKERQFVLLQTRGTAKHKGHQSGDWTSWLTESQEQEPSRQSG